MKIAITGGLGFIGLHLAHRLLDHGHAPVLIDSLTPQIHGELPEVSPPEGAVVVRLDVRELGQRPDLLEECDAVVHLAAETGTAQSMYQIAQYASVNGLGTAALLETVAACARRPRQLVLASSRSVYGEGAYEHPNRPGELLQPLPRTAAQMNAGQWDHLAEDGKRLIPVATPERMPMRPGSVYAATKGAQEMLVSAACAALGVQATIFRFQNVYGEGQSLRNPYTGIMSIFYNRARQGMEIPVYEDGEESRDFVHVNDVVEAITRALVADLPPGVLLNVGSGRPTSVVTLARTLIQAADLDAPVRVSGKFRLGDIRHCWADVSELQRLLGFIPQISLEAGLARFCAWARTQPAYQDRLDEATRELRRKGMAS